MIRTPSRSVCNVLGLCYLLFIDPQRLWMPPPSLAVCRKIFRDKSVYKVTVIKGKGVIEEIKTYY